MKLSTTVSFLRQNIPQKMTTYLFVTAIAKDTDLSVVIWQTYCRNILRTMYSTVLNYVKKIYPRDVISMFLQCDCDVIESVSFVHNYVIVFSLWCYRDVIERWIICRTVMVSTLNTLVLTRFGNARNKSITLYQWIVRQKRQCHTNYFIHTLDSYTLAIYTNATFLIRDYCFYLYIEKLPIMSLLRQADDFMSTKFSKLSSKNQTCQNQKHSKIWDKSNIGKNHHA